MKAGMRGMRRYGIPRHTYILGMCCVLASLDATTYIPSMSSDKMNIFLNILTFIF